MKSRNKGIFLSYGYLLINMLCGLFLSSYLISQLGDTEFGIYQTISSFANYLVMLEFGTGTVMTRNISMCRGSNESKKRINENISTIWTITNILACVIAVVSVILYFFIDDIYVNSFTPDNIKTAKNIFFVIVANLIISFYAQSFTGLTLAFEKYSFGPVLKTVKIVTRTVLLGVLLLKFKYAIIIAIIDTIISIVTLVYSYIYCKKNFQVSFRFKYFNIDIFKRVLPFSLALFLQTIINQANNSVDKFFIGVFLSPEAVAQYSIALFVFSVFSSICVVPVNMYAPQIARDLKSGVSVSELTKVLSSAARLTALIGGSVLFGFIAAGRPFIALLYGENYLEQGIWLISVILMAPALLVNLLGVAINVIDVLEKRMVYSIVLGITTIINILLTLMGIKWFGMLGAATATCLSVLIFQFPIICYYYGKVICINVRCMLKECFIHIIPCQIIAAGVGYLISGIISFDTKLNSLFSLVLSGLAYLFVFCFLLYIVDRDFRKKTKNICFKVISICKKH